MNVFDCRGFAVELVDQDVKKHDTRDKEIVLTGLFTLKDIDLEGGFTTSRFDTQLWDISET